MTTANSIGLRRLLKSLNKDNTVHAALLASLPKRKITMSKTLAECLPSEFRTSEYNSSPAYRHRDAIVVTEHDNRIKPWPGRQKYVFVWYVLDNGKAVAWNENPARGWSFPVISYRE